MASAAVFQTVAKHRVTKANPARDDDELDIERCAALHNTLAMYGWICSGKKIADMEKKSWWAKNGSTAVKEMLNPALAKFLAKSFALNSSNFFYFVSGLSRPTQMMELDELLEDHRHNRSRKFRFIILYSTSAELVSQPAGIV